MDTTYFYSDTNKALAPIKTKLEEFANKYEQNIFMLRMPKDNIEVADEYEKCFLLLSPGFKLAIVNGGCQKNIFENYCEDIDDAISYLYTKYEYKKELGRFRPLYEKLRYEVDNPQKLNDLDSLFEELSLHEYQDKRYSTIFVSLCTGSINDISRVKCGVPQTLLEKVKQKIQLFDADQTRFIYQHLDKKRIKIQGLSGTGKTELLLHKLKELYTKNGTNKIFVTCHNKILANALRNRIPQFFNFMKVSQQIEWDERLWCRNAWGKFSDENSGFYRYLCSFYNIPYSKYSKFMTFDTVCKNADYEIRKLKKNKNFKFAFDYILVDECQDFPDSFFDLCDLVTKEQVYIAGDIFQSIFEEHNINDYAADYFLTKCYRTDPKTLMFAHALGLGLFEKKKLRWLRKRDWEACGYTYDDNGDTISLSRQPVVRFQGVEPNYESVKLSCFSIDKVAESVVQVIEDIRKDNKDVTCNDICIILLDDEEYIYTWANWIESAISIKFGWNANKAYETKQNIKDSILISNRNNVKGLEYPFVICVTKGLEFSVPYRNSLYTMLTRSFLKSYLLISDKQKQNFEALSQKYKEINESLKLVLKKPSEQEREEIETSFKQLSNRKPLAEELRDILTKKNIPQDNIENLIEAALKLGWQDLSSDDLMKKVDLLIDLSDF